MGEGSIGEKWGCCMRILHVIASLDPRAGGPSEVLPGVCRALGSAGNTVEVLTTNMGIKGTYCMSGWDTITDSDVRVQFCSVQFRPLLFSVELARYLREGIARFDIVHVHGLYRFTSTFAAYEARRQGVPYVIRPHGSLDPFLYKTSSKSLWLKRQYERMFDLPNLNAASAVHYTAEDERKKASFLELASPSIVVPNGLDWERYRQLPSRGQFRTRLGIGDAPMILFLGRIHFKKGLDLLVEAFDAVRQQIPDVQLVIVGPENDDYRNKVRSWVEARGMQRQVHFVGSLTGKDVVQAYVDADVFALPSYTENFGMTVAEAMACALPVVISDQVNIHAEISNADAGIVTQCNAGEVAAALIELLRDEDRRRQMGTFGRKLVRDTFTWPVIIYSLVNEYESIIRRHRADRS